MKKLNVALLSLIVCMFSLAEADDSIEENYTQAKSEASELDQKTRDMMSTLYEINTQMKGMSKRRGILDNKMMWANSMVTKIALSIAHMEKMLETQRRRLSQRLRAIYKLSDESLVRSIFSSVSAKDLDQTMKYLQIISDYDFGLIKNYSKNLVALQGQKSRLNAEVKKLMTAKEQLKNHEMQLALQQEEKSKVLSELRNKKEDVVHRISQIHDIVERSELQGLLDVSFYENKGQLALPIKAKLSRGYGIYEDPQFEFQLGHKGLSFTSDATVTDITAVYKGRVMFIGEVPGHGKTLVVGHGDHYYTVYALMRDVLVQEGDEITQGKKLGSAGKRFYFEVRHFSEAINPEEWISKTSS